MRAIVAVLLFVSAVHAALWGVFQDQQQAPDFNGMLPSVSYAPFEPGHIVDNSVDPDTDSSRPEEARGALRARFASTRRRKVTSSFHRSPPSSV